MNFNLYGEMSLKSQGKRLIQFEVKISWHLQIGFFKDATRHLPVFKNTT